MPLPKKRWPKATRKNADKYSRDSIQKMVEAADTDEKDKYSDIDSRKGQSTYTTSRISAGQ
jgi:hypothetical protein